MTQGQGLCLSQRSGVSSCSSYPRQGFVPTAGATWMKQPPADDTHQPAPHVPQCSHWAPLSLAVPQPHPSAPCAVPSCCPRCDHQPQMGACPLHPFPAQPWQQVVPRPTKQFPVPRGAWAGPLAASLCTQWAGRAGATLRPQVCIGCNKDEWEPPELHWFFHQGQSSSSIQPTLVKVRVSMRSM